jgi:hypothetical protein
MSGGSSKSESTSKNTTITTDKRLVVDNGATGISADNSTVNYTSLDGGAISSAFDFAMNTFAVTTDILKANVAAVDHINSTTTEAIQKANANALAVTDTNRYLVAGGLAVVGIVAIKIWSK